MRSVTAATGGKATARAGAVRPPEVPRKAAGARRRLEYASSGARRGVPGRGP